MNPQPGYQVAPWELCWRGLDVEALEQTESTFALSNGHIGLRGSLEEGEPRSIPGTYLNGFFERRPLPHAEPAYGYPEDGQTVVNVTDGKIIRLLVVDEPLDMRYGTALDHYRVLDFRSGTLRRRTEWVSPTGRHILITSERLVSFTQRAVAAIHYEVEPLDGPMQLVLQSDLLANEPIEPSNGDPRTAAVLQAPLVADFAASKGFWAVLAHHTRNSGLRMAAGMDHEVDAPSTIETGIEADGDLARLTVAADVGKGERLRITKYLAYGWSSQRSTPALRSQVDAALAGARQTGWQGLLDEQRAYLDDFWACADIELEGDAELQQAVRFALFHVLQAGARGETRAIPARGLTGPGYDGHAFWDTETFILPVLTYTVPDAARNALLWRHSTLDKARRRAEQLSLAGAAFPWRSINGEECSGYWPAGTAAVHINADVADATLRYIWATGDKEFEVEHGLELLVETARLWASLGHRDSHGGFRIDGVTGPDEYTALQDNNIYTNLMAQRNLREAALLCEKHPERARELGVEDEEIEEWKDAAERMMVPYDTSLQVHPQSEGFTDHAAWDFANTPPEKYPLLLHYPYFDLYRKQVVKQADLVLAMHLRGDAFTTEQKARNVAYYEPLTVRDSSLSACTQAVLAAEVGHLDLAYDYLAESALIDLHDTHHNVRNGLHLASLAGAWIAIVAGFGGMRDHGGTITFAPRLPDELTGIRFRMTILDSRLQVQIRKDEAIYQLLEGGTLRTAHHGKPFSLSAGDVVAYPIPPLRPRPRPHSPPGRAPTPRRHPTP
ncbi:glycoside hydrolase family 65 protein [Thermasporomyces composti]|jgi:alpha,alpha-trehalose phosphorylase|uniref:Alpha,alpha-trehalose phosphorylase n=1 Tax=Thermasporomyces composti TaxID=696763 RepID=A0A3D9VAT9_THECX|nr:glycosyl hydrolase family 65 protein [Thermasporomyces composti]REF37270.1 alpha,alpha-trehalose phosphorylase [Thermasporomyces composti]